MVKKKTTDLDAINYDDAAKLIHIWFAQLIISICRGYTYILTSDDKDEEKKETWFDYLDGLELIANTPYEDLPEEKKESLINLVKEIVGSIKI